MGVARTPGPGRPESSRRSIRFTFVTMVIVPVVCLVVLWALVIAFTPSGTDVRRGLFSAGHQGLADVAVQAGGGLAVVLAAAILMGLFVRRLAREVSGLETTARHLAEAEVPQAVAGLRGAELPAGIDPDREPPDPKIAEIAEAAAAITGLQHTAVAAAVDEASMRKGVAQVFVSLSRRNQSLLQRQLHLIDTLEQKASDPAELAELFSLDHLTTRMRRHAENLIVLSGSSPGRSWSEPVPVIDVIRGAMAEVEDYQRVRVLARTQDAVNGSAAADMMHLLAELIENATLFSPSGACVEIRTERTANGFVVEVEDRGVGIQPGQLSEINQRLLRPPDFAMADPDRLGLFVVGRLAARHGVRVSLETSSHGGTTAAVLIPHTIMVPAASARRGLAPGEMPAIEQTQHEPIRRDRRSEDMFGLAPRRSALPGTPQVDVPAAADEPVSMWAAPTVLDAPSTTSDAKDDGDGAHGTGVANGTKAGSGPGAAGGSSAASGSWASNGSGAANGAGVGKRGVARDAAGKADPLAGLVSGPGTRRPRHGPIPLPRRGSALPPAAGTGGIADASGTTSASGTKSARGTTGADGTTGTSGTKSADGTTGAGGAESAGTYRGLPRRVRQASLSPHLRDGGSTGTNPFPVWPGSSTPADPAQAQPTQAQPIQAERTPEAARAVVAAFRSGWQRQRPAGPPQSHAEAGEPPAAQPGAGETPVAETPGEARVTKKPRKTLPRREPPSAKPSAAVPPTAVPPTAVPPTAESQGEETQWKSGARPEPEQI